MGDFSIAMLNLIHRVKAMGKIGKSMWKLRDSDNQWRTSSHCYMGKSSVDYDQGELMASLMAYWSFVKNHFNLLVCGCETLGSSLASHSIGNINTQSSESLPPNHWIAWQTEYMDLFDFLVASWNGCSQIVHVHFLHEIKHPAIGVAGYNWKPHETRLPKGARVRHVDRIS